MQSLQQTQASLANPATPAQSDAKASISVVVPARNEEATIAAVVERSYQAFAQLGRGGEVLVVNDGSTDHTAVILADLQTRYSSLRVFTHRRSRGMTAGLQRMFTASQGAVPYTHLSRQSGKPHFSASCAVWFFGCLWVWLCEH